MRVLSLFSVALCFAASLLFVAAEPHNFESRRRHSSKRVSWTERNTSVRHHFSKRIDGAQLTYYADGLGACGGTNVPSDFIVALNSDQYGSGEYCFQMITITANGKTAQAQIVDECPGCPYGGLDCSQGLFQYFAPLSDGVLTGSWTFNSGAQSSSSSSTPPPPTSTTSEAPSSTWTPPPTSTSSWSSSSTSTTSTTSYTPTSSSTSTTLSSTSTTSSSTSSSSSSSSSLAPNPTAEAVGAVNSPSSSNPEVLAQLNLALVGIGYMIGTGQGAS